MTVILKTRHPADPVYAYPGTFTATALPDNCVGFWLFGKLPGETNAQAASRCAWNRAAGASNSLAIRRRWWPGGFPVFGANYATFREDTPLVTGVLDFGANGGCVFVIARCDDDTVGSSGLHRGFMVGSYGGNTNRGFGMEFADDASSTARVQDYDSAGSIQTNQIDLGTSINDFEKIRLYYGETGRVSGGNKLLAMVNLSGDGTIPDPTDTTLTGGRKVGSQNFSIGGRIEDSTTRYEGSITKDIAVVAIFNALPTTPERDALQAQMLAVASDMNITMLATAW